MTPTPRSYVAFGFDAVNGNDALSSEFGDRQSTRFSTSTRSPPSVSRTCCTNVEPAALRVISSATRTGPRSITFTVGFDTYSRAGACTVS